MSRTFNLFLWGFYYGTIQYLASEDDFSFTKCYCFSKVIKCDSYLLFCVNINY